MMELHNAILSFLLLLLLLLWVWVIDLVGLMLQLQAILVDYYFVMFNLKNSDHVISY